MTIDISKFVQVPKLKWIGGASYAYSEDTSIGSYEVERLASDSEWFLSRGLWRGGVHPSLDAAKAAAQADYAARKLAGLTPTPALVTLINERHKLRAALSDLLTDAEWLDREYGDERERDGWDRGDKPEGDGNVRGEVEYEYEVWQDNDLQAWGRETDYASAKAEAEHCAMIYAQDGPVEMRIYEKRLLSAVQQPAEQSANHKRRPYNASGSLSEYGVFPESDAQ